MENTPKALELAQNARAEALRIDYQKGLAYSLYLSCLCHFILADDADLQEHTFQALSLFEGLNDLSGAAQAHNLLAIIYRRHDRHDDALDHFRQSLEIRRNIGDRRGQSASLNNIALIHHAGSRFDLALENLFQSLELSEAEDDPEAGAYALVNIARVYFATSEFDRALRFAQRGLEQNRRSNDRALDSSLLTLLGTIYSRLDQRDDAINCLKRSLEISHHTGNLNDEGDALLALGIIYQDIAQFHESNHALHRALTIMRQLNSSRDEADVLVALGRGFQRQSDHQNALDVLQKAMESAVRGQSDKQIEEIHLRMSEIHEAMGAYKLALHHFRAYDHLAAAHGSIDATRRVRELTSAWEFQHEPDSSKTEELSHALNALRDADQKNAALLSRLKQQAELLEQLAREDGLTGVANRRWLNLKLAQEFDRAVRFGHSLSVVMIDIDDFKQVNDRLSHPVGDSVLIKVASLMRDQLRSVDVVGRYGGEEFMLILVETGRERAQSVCERLLRSVSDFDWQTIHSELDRITLSIGIACRDSLGEQEMDSPGRMVQMADQAMYRAKKSGKNRVCSDEWPESRK